LGGKYSGKMAMVVMVGAVEGGDAWMDRWEANIYSEWLDGCR